MDVSIRKLRYFVVVAEELHFTQAAGRLFIAQQSLSKQIRELEEQLGTTLFHRTRRTVELTDAGRVLLERIRPVLSGLDDAIDATRRTGRGAQQCLRIGFGMFAALELTSLILEEFTRARPEVGVEMREYPLTDQTAGLLDGWAHIAFVRPPLAVPGLVYEPVFTEPRVLSISRKAPLARQSELDVADVLDLQLSVGRSEDGEYRRFWCLDQYRTGPGRPPLRTSTNTEELQLVANGLACTVNPAAVARYLPHAEVACVPIRGIPGSTVALAWLAGREPRLVAEFVAAARTVIQRETNVVDAIEHPFEERAYGSALTAHAVTPGS
jgi:DNA-binding transcriptional LysR family regulator